MRAAALAIALAAAIPMIALADSPVADLGSVLAPTPTADYIEATPSATILDGPFTAQEYADFITANGLNGSGVVAALTLLGFKRGYARTWLERGQRRAMVERVFEFSAGSGAHSFYGQNKLGAQTSKSYKGDIDTSSVPKSFGVKVDESSTNEFIGVFEKGNDSYEVLMASLTEDLTTECWEWCCSSSSWCGADRGLSRSPSGSACRRMAPGGGTGCSGGTQRSKRRLERTAPPTEPSGGTGKPGAPSPPRGIRARASPGPACACWRTRRPRAARPGAGA